MEEDVPIESKLITKRIAAAQKAVEVQNFEARKHLLEYDDVMNKQRQAVYGMRRQLLEGVEQKDRVTEMARGIVASFVDMRCPEGAHPDTYDYDGYQTDINSQFGVKLNVQELQVRNRQEIEDYTMDLLTQRYQEKEDLVGPDIMRQTERWVMLQVIDDQWKDHLLSMDHLKEGIGLRGYGQKDPLVEYKKESYSLFEAMMDRIEEESLRYLFFFQVAQGERPPMAFPDEEEYVEAEAAPEPTEQERAAAQSSMVDFTRNIQRKKEKELAELQFVGGDGSATQQKQAISNKVGRNDPCPCGSGKKYKKCHGQAA
jgi:preprotein translocase subunit SecA